MLQRKNWPGCCPFMRHDIAMDVPVGRQAIVRRGYCAWVFVVLAFVVNWVTITAM